MSDLAMNDEREVATPDQEKRPWVDPEVSESKSLISYPDGLILQGASGSTGP